jgi:hypothetical protein
MDLRDTGFRGVIVFIWLGIGPVALCCEHSNEPWDSIKAGECRN